MTSSPNPLPVPGLTSIKSLAAGDDHSLALKQDGTALAWGGNYAGQLGDGTFIKRSNPTSVTLPADVTKLATITAHSFAIRGANGLVSAWGDNFYGQLGIGLTGFYPTAGTVQFR